MTWRIDRYETHRDHLREHITSDANGIIATMHRYASIRGEEYPQVIAHARLIAAAPDLLEAAKAILDEIEPLWRSYVSAINAQGEPAPSAVAVTLERLRAAVHAAEGGSE